MNNQLNMQAYTGHMSIGMYINKQWPHANNVMYIDTLPLL